MPTTPIITVSEQTPPPTYSAALADVPPPLTPSATSASSAAMTPPATPKRAKGKKASPLAAVPQPPPQQQTMLGALGSSISGLLGFGGGGGGIPQEQAQTGPPPIPPMAMQQQQCCAPKSPSKQKKQKKASSSSSSRVGGSTQIRRIGYDRKRDTDAELVGVIITICAGSSYDNLFTTIRQQGADGTRTAVWKVNPAALPEIVAALETSAAAAAAAAATTAASSAGAGATTTDLKTMVDEIMSVDPEAVAFNWECCSGCSRAGFGSETDTHAALAAAEYAVSHGHMAMFSDFSLMALIKDWRPDVLGPNPFRQFGAFSGAMELKFDVATLEQCPSAQLQTLGKLAESGTATVHAMGGTIAYTVDAAGAAAGAAAGKYALEVLTVAESFSDGTGIPRDAITSTGSNTGAAGHVILKYEVGGGTLLTSCGHWIELSKLDTTEEALLRITEQELGGEEMVRMRDAFESSASPQMRSELLQTMSSQCVQRQSCASYSPRRKGSGFGGCG